MTQKPSDSFQLKGWSLFALGALGAAGLLALLLALSRTPGIGPRLPWSAEFFYRALVTHVMLSFQVWFLAMLAVLIVLARPPGAWGKTVFYLACLALAALIIPALMDQGQPLLNNYVPILVHPLFIAALCGLAGLIVVLAVWSLPLLFSPDPARFGTACAGLSYLAACLCFALGWIVLPSGLNLEFATERTVWGGGHVLQIVNTMMVMVCWYRLALIRWSQPLLSPSLAKAAFWGLTLFALVSPLIYTLSDVSDLAHRQIFTHLLWIGLPLPPAVFALALIVKLVKNPADFKDPVYLSLVLSVAVFALGGLAGFFLGVGDTRTPAHYHAVIGGVNLGLMGLFPALILPLLGKPKVSLRWSFLFYASGQTLHVLGLYAAGLAGVPRKTSGLAQGIDTLAKKIALDIVGLGGALAVLGGVLFIYHTLRSLLKSQSPPPLQARPDQPTVLPSSKSALALLAACLLLLWFWMNTPLVDMTEPATLDRIGFEQKVAEMITMGDTGLKVDDHSLIHPPTSDVYLTFRQWAIEPALLLDAGKTYHFHLMALDVIHSVALLDNERLLQPNQEASLIVTTPDSGELTIQCGEFCGNGHAKMASKIILNTH